MAPGAAAQTSHGFELETRLHEREIYAERMSAFRRAWDAADAPLREVALAALQRSLGPGAPLGAWPSMIGISSATRLLRGEPAERLERGGVLELLDCLDMMLVPGALESPNGPPSEGARGEALRVRVWPVDDQIAARCARDIELQLDWVAPDGRRERARRESVAAAAWRAPGFDMYVRAPLDPSASWQLVPSVEIDGVRVDGWPVAAPTVSERDLRGEALGAAADSLRGETLLVSLEALLLVRFGVRGFVGESARLDRVLAGQADVGAARMWALDPEDEHGLGQPAQRLWVYGQEEGEPQTARVLLLPAPEPLAPRGQLEGELGAAWRALADAQSAAIVAYEHASSETLEPELVVAAARERFPGAEIVLVLRADGMRSIALRLLGKPPLAIDRLVLSLPLSLRGPLLPAVPTLIHTPLEPPTDAPDDHSYALAPAGSFVDDRALPAAIGAWLDAAGE